jgi:hypothetical protein
MGASLVLNCMNMDMVEDKIGEKYGAQVAPKQDKSIQMRHDKWDQVLPASLIIDSDQPLL